MNTKAHTNHSDSPAQAIDTQPHDDPNRRGGEGGRNAPAVTERRAGERRTRRRGRGLLAGVALAATAAIGAVNAPAANAFSVEDNYGTSTGHCRFPNSLAAMVYRQGTWSQFRVTTRVFTTRGYYDLTSPWTSAAAPGMWTPLAGPAAPAGYTYQSYIQYRQYLYYMPIPYWTTGGEWVLKDDGYGRLVYICRA